MWSLASRSDVEFEIIDKDGNKWVTAKQCAEAAQQPPRSLLKHIADLRSREEIKEGVHFMCIPLRTAGGEQITMVLSYRGVMRVFMRSDAPRAKEFRVWATSILKPVSLHGYYLPEGAESALVNRVSMAVLDSVKQVVMSRFGPLSLTVGLQKLIRTFRRRSRHACQRRVNMRLRYSSHRETTPESDPVQP